MKSSDRAGDPLNFYTTEKLQIASVLTGSPKGKPHIIVTKPEQIVIVC
jgi:hypothetical protein